MLEGHLYERDTSQAEYKIHKLEYQL